MEEIVFKATKRIVHGKQVKRLRREGILPAILYGHNITPMAINLNYREASQILPSVSTSHLVVVDVEGERHTSLVREKQRHPVLGSLIHIDFMAVSMTEKLHATVQIEFVGDAPAVKDYGGLVVMNIEQIDVYCLPKDLPEKIVVNLVTLSKFGDSIHVNELDVPPNVEVITPGEEIVVLISAPAGEEVEVVAEEVSSTEPEIVEKKKKEEEEE